MAQAKAAPTVSFSHIQIYCDSVKELQEYKQLEQKLNAFVPEVLGAGRATDVAAGRQRWLALSEAHGNPVTGPRDPAQWKTAGQDLIEQMMVGLGWRITGSCEGPETETTTMLVTSPDAEGVKLVVTAHQKHSMEALAQLDEEVAAKKLKSGVAQRDPLDASNLIRFAQNRVGREGIAVLGFNAAPGAVDEIYRKYKELHPKLLFSPSPQVFKGAKLLEVFAYYQGEARTSDADCGTLIRFVEEEAGSGFCVLPGIEQVAAEFDGVSFAAYNDHWVSNVVSRVGFMETLTDVLGFTPKVDFNAGVVAAGEAQIESTVIGNNPGKLISDKKAALKDQSQVYLPTNNAISEAGHVHSYIQEIGQGIQHTASRVSDLPQMVQNTNDIREMTGAGLSFLGIPPSYYGSLTAKRMVKDLAIEPARAEQCVTALHTHGIVSSSDIVDFGVTRERVVSALPADAPESVVEYVLRARYNNLYELLRDHISEATYLSIVRNNILVDVQGEDLLFQIFSANILQRHAGEESPFFEFIQRVCSEKIDPRTGCPLPLKPGCGGFGIRNFLTLFLSIEVGKATKQRAEAEAAGDAAAAAYFGKVVDAFTSQMDEANPILTTISDAMTAEGEALERGDAEEAERWAALKVKGNEDLQVVSSKYHKLMRDMREAAPRSRV